MKTIEHVAGCHIREVCAEALKIAQESGEAVKFAFNDKELIAYPSHSIGDLYAQWEKETGNPVLTAEQEQQQARNTIEMLTQEQERAISKARVMTEKEMREAKAPWPKSLDELAAYVKTLVDRPHDYGTCVYAMSLAAVAAYQYVAHALGPTGFQAGCADLDIVRRTRGLENGFRLLDYSNLLFPQYCDADHFPHWDELLAEPKLRKEIADKARANLAEKSDVHPNVKAHWERLAAMSP